MKIALSILLLFFGFYCKAQHSVAKKIGNHHSKEYKLQITDTSMFKKLDYKKAVKLYGKPSETRKIKISDNTLSLILSNDLIQKYFPKNGDYPKEGYLIEANWQTVSESWITVWYKLENKIWKPINTLVTI